MSEFNLTFDRKKAVCKSAELLRDFGAAFFPLDVQKLFSAFGKQMMLVPYSEMEKAESPDAVRPEQVSKDGFCTRVPNVLLRFGNEHVTGNTWYIYYDSGNLEARVRFTLMHEMGHIQLSHHQFFNTNTLVGLENEPAYKAADAQADVFSASILAPAPAVFRVLKGHGFSYDKKKASWLLTDPNAPFLRNLGSVPNPEVLVMTAFGLSQSAANFRLSELPYELELWKDLDSGLYSYIESLPHRSGWFCWVCHTRRRTTSMYCPGCGHGFHYEYKDFGAFSRPVMGLRKNGQFEFCSVCGNTDFPEDAEFCPICGNQIINECENAFHTDGDFIRSGMEIIRGTHRCRPSDIFCGTCGMVTTFGRRHGPRENMWLPTPTSDRCRIAGSHYPEIIPADDGKLMKCPTCGSTRTMREGRYCADCQQPLQNVCVSGEKGAHACGVNDRYCSVCGKPTIFKEAGWLPEYTETDTFSELLEAEKHSQREQPAHLLIQTDGEICVS